MDERLRFVFAYERDEESMRLCVSGLDQPRDGLCVAAALSSEGSGGIGGLNRAPLRHPNQTAAQIEEAVLGLRQAHMTWGPRKLKRILERDQPGAGGRRTARWGRS